MRYFRPGGVLDRVATQNAPSGFLRTRMGSNHARNPSKQALSSLMARVVEANIDLIAPNRSIAQDEKHAQDRLPQESAHRRTFGNPHQHGAVGSNRRHD